MAERPMTTATAGPEHEARGARRVWTPFALAIGLVLVVMAIVMGVTRPWEDTDTAQRDVAPPVPTQTR